MNIPHFFKLIENFLSGFRFTEKKRNIKYKFPIHSSFFLFFLFLFWLCLWHTEDPTIAIATWDPGWICELCHSSWQHQIITALGKARDQTCILMDTSPSGYHEATRGSRSPIINIFLLCGTFVKIGESVLLTVIN